MDMRKISALMVLAVLALTGVIFATTTSEQKMQSVICGVYVIVKNLLPILGFVLFVLAGVAYAAGQFFGAEMRGRATGWGMNMVVGAIIAFILAIIGPIVIKAFYPTTTTVCGAAV